MPLHFFDPAFFPVRCFYRFRLLRVDHFNRREFADPVPLAALAVPRVQADVVAFAGIGLPFLIDRLQKTIVVTIVQHLVEVEEPLFKTESVLALERALVRAFAPAAGWTDPAVVVPAEPGQAVFRIVAALSPDCYLLLLGSTFLIG